MIFLLGTGRSDCLRQQMAVVLQDVFLFSGSVADNIRLGNNHISQETIEWAAQQVNAHQFIQNLSRQYDTPVKERGTMLSLGQKQTDIFCPGPCCKSADFDP